MSKIGMIVNSPGQSNKPKEVKKVIKPEVVKPEVVKPEEKSHLYITSEIKKVIKPKVLFICDVKNWAWYFKSVQLKKYLSNEFDITCILAGGKIDPKKYDVYFTFGYSYIDIEPLKGIPKNKKVTGITSHRPISVIEPKMNLAGAVHANSKLLLSQLRNIHDNIYYLPNGVDETLFRPTTPIPNERENIIVGHVGKLSPLKGQLEFIEPAVKKAKCLYHPNYKDHTEALTHETMPSIYNGFDCFIVASQEDGTPNTALEAAACGRPIISNRVGNMPEFIQDGINGFLVEKNVDKYAEKILYFRDHRNELIKMGNIARKTVLESWTWKIQAENYRKMLWDIVNNRKSTEYSNKGEIEKRIIDISKELEKIDDEERDLIKKRESLKVKSELLKKDMNNMKRDMSPEEWKIKYGPDEGTLRDLEVIRREKQKKKKEEPKQKEEPTKIIKRERSKNGKPDILILSDVRGWAWDVKAKNIKKWLSDDFNIFIRYFQSSPTDKFDRKEKFDLYFTFDCGASHFLSHIPAEQKLIGVTSHTYTSYRGNWKQMLDGSKFHHANSVLLQKELEKYYSEVYYLPNGVDETLFAFKERDITKPFTVGYVGKNTTRKGYVQFVIESCRQAEVKLKSQVCRFNSPNVIKPGKIPPFYHDVDMIMIASDMDGTPNQLLEATSTGRCFVGNKIGNVPEFINEGINGYMVERNVKSYIERLNWMKNNREVVQEMGRKARQTVEEKWTWKIQAENYRKMFKEVLGK